MRTAVINNKEALVQGQLQPVGKNVGGTLQLGKVLTFLPGLNLIDVLELETIRKNQAFDKFFTTLIPSSHAPEQNPEKVGKPILAVMEVVNKEGKKRPLEIEDTLPLAKISEEQCKLMITETLMPDVLRQWSNEEVRPAVRHEIQKQLEAIGSGEKTAGPVAHSR